MALSIALNKVGVDIDGKTYEFYKVNLGFSRELVEMQSNVKKLQNVIAKKYEISVDEINTSDKVSEDEKLDIATAGMAVSTSMKKLLVNQDEADIIDKLGEDNIGELITALK